MAVSMKTEDIVKAMISVEDALDDRGLYGLAMDAGELRSRIIEALEEQDKMEELP